MLKNRYSVTGNSLRLRSTPQNPGSVSRVQKVEASLFPTGTGTTPISMMPAGGVYYNRLFTGILPEMEESLIPYYRDAYRFDSVAGATVDIIGSFPFSDWTLTGVNTDAMKPFNDTLSRLNIRSLLPEISNTYLVDGAFIGSLVYDARTSTFQDILVHDRLNCTITPQPFFALDPVITANTAQYLNNFVHSNSPYAQRIMETYPKAMLDTFMQGQTVLDPITTVFIPRKTMMDEPTTSYLKRILPFYVLKKIMYRATLIEASKRMRATTHVQMGTDTWEPTPKEMQQVLAQFQLSEMDPLGAWVVTRQGVQVQDIRQAGDFWKWTDIIDTLIPHELRALGISEAFLAGDAAYACLAGNTLIPTSEGLKRIDSFGEGKDRKKIVPVKATLDSRYGKGQASSWQYNGYQNTYRVTTETGNSIQATGNHPVLVYSNETGTTDWKRTDKLSIGDVLCVSRNTLVRTKPLKLNVPLPEPRTLKVRASKTVNRTGNGRGLNPNSRVDFVPGSMKVPKYMTPKLAYWLALLISEGYTRGKDHYCEEHNRAGGLGFSNTDLVLVKRFSSLAKELFGVECKPIGTQTVEEQNEYADKTGAFRASMDSHATWFGNRRVVDWLEAIGVYVTPGRVEGKTPSYFKKVPWSVLQADVESQRAFLAAYAECDGTIGESTTWISASLELKQGIQAMLNSQGYQPVIWKEGKGTVKLHKEDSADFWTKASKYLVSKSFKDEPIKYSKWDGLPGDYWTSLVESRKVKFDRHGQYFLTDDKRVIRVSRNKASVSQTTDAKPWGFNTKELKRFSYQFFDEGKYDNFLHFLKDLSPEAHAKFLLGMKYRYRYTPIVRIEDAGKEHVYDISMKAGTEPAFVANGLVVHNTAETAMTVFLENMDAYRNFVTFKLFTSKLFPLIAVMNRLYKDKGKAKSNTTIEGLMHNLGDRSNLLLPDLQWHKKLITKDASEMDLLDKLSEKGVPIPLKMLASTAGVDLQSLLQDLEEDKKIRGAISKITGQPVSTPGPQAGDDGGMGYEEGSLRELEAKAEVWSAVKGVLARRRSLLQRDFGELGAPLRMSKSGNKVHSVYNERATVRKFDEMTAKAAQNLKDPNVRAAARKRVLKAWGHIPNIIK